MKALVMYHHGIGDVIILTPHLRKLYQDGYKIDLMCRESITQSNLLRQCEYIDKLITIENPWQSTYGFHKQNSINLNIFNSMKNNYDWYGYALHEKDNISSIKYKIDINSKELGLTLQEQEKSLEIFIPDSILLHVEKYVNSNYPNGYIFRHTYPEHHPGHIWDSSDYIKENFSELPIVNTGKDGNYYMWSNDINYSFALLKHAKHIVLSSSVMVHAAEALNLKIDVINYGKPDRKVWPIDISNVLKIREAGKWVK